MERPLGDGHRGFADELLGDAVTLAMAESLSGEYRDFSQLLEDAATRRLEMIGRSDALPRSWRPRDAAELIAARAHDRDA